MLQVRLTEPAFPLLSVTVKVLVRRPHVVGVPVTIPVVGPTVRPAGRLVALKVYGALPPEARRARVTGLPM